MDQARVARRISSPFGWHGRLFNAFVVADTYIGRRRVDRRLGRVRRWNQYHLARILGPGELVDPLQQPMREVVATDAIDPATFRRDFQRQSLPVVLRGAAAAWPAIERWSPASLDARMGTAEISAIDGCQRSVEDEQSGIARITPLPPMSLHDQLQAASEGGAAYLCFDGSLFDRDPALLADFDLDLLRTYLGPLPLARHVPVKLFIGGDGTSTQWHTDGLQTTFVQLHGYKQWYLAPPAFSPCLDARVALLDQQYVHSMIDFRQPDLVHHPLYARLPVFEVRLQPGDILYVPAFWWHCVVNEGTSIGVSIWWYSLLHPLRTHPTLLWLTVLSPQHLVRLLTNAVRRRRKGGGHTSGNIYGRHGTTSAPPPEVQRGDTPSASTGTA